jgi:hypothetical protein
MREMEVLDSYNILDSESESNILQLSLCRYIMKVIYVFK